MNDYNGTLLPTVHRLPVELLLQIFSHCVSVDRELAADSWRLAPVPPEVATDSAPLWTLSHVCSKWRAVVNGYAPYWTNPPTLSDDDEDTKVRDQNPSEDPRTQVVLLHAQRSGSAPVSLYYTFGRDWCQTAYSDKGTEPDQVPVSNARLRFVLDHSSICQLKHLTIFTCHPNPILPFERHLSNITSLELELGHHFRWCPENASKSQGSVWSKFPLHKLFGACNLLQSLSIKCAVVEETWDYDQTRTWPSLKRLEIWGTFIPWASLHSVLSANPQLESLSIRTTGGFSCHEPETVGRIRLPNLTSLELCEWAQQYNGGPTYKDGMEVVPHIPALLRVLDLPSTDQIAMMISWDEPYLYQFLSSSPIRTLSFHLDLAAIRNPYKFLESVPLLESLAIVLDPDSAEPDSEWTVEFVRFFDALATPNANGTFRCPQLGRLELKTDLLNLKAHWQYMFTAFGKDVVRALEARTSPSSTTVPIKHLRVISIDAFSEQHDKVESREIMSRFAALHHKGLLEMEISNADQRQRYERLLLDGRP